MSRISFVPTSEWSEELRTFVAADSATELELGITHGCSPMHRNSQWVCLALAEP